AHVVLFTMKKGTDAKAIDEVIKDCHGILSKIPAVRSVKAGRPTKEKAEKFVRDDYHVALIVMVDDYEGLKAYHVDPKHKEFVEKHGKLFDLDTLRVFDFTFQKP
ncbi:MAG: Dabb family protein, partial [Gemmataceae bacterium]|nr:Dabb family protein [Gemmataceae bacterium]